MQRSSLIIRSIWAICLLIGGANHARILLQHGLGWDYGGVGAGSALYWSSLTLIDPLVAALLFLRPKAGIIVAVILITTNVIHNVMVRHIPANEILTYVQSSPNIIAQIAFMLFVIATAQMAWKGVDNAGG